MPVITITISAGTGICMMMMRTTGSRLPSLLTAWMIIMIHLTTAAITADMIFRIQVTIMNLLIAATATAIAVHGITITTGTPGIQDPTGTGTAVQTGTPTGNIHS